MKKIIFRIFIWYHWKKFYRKTKEVAGYESLETINYDLDNLERKIRNDNEIPVGQKIVLDNSKKTDLKDLILYSTLKIFSEEGDFLKQITELYKTY